LKGAAQPENREKERTCSPSDVVGGKIIPRNSGEPLKERVSSRGQDPKGAAPIGEGRLSGLLGKKRQSFRAVGAELFLGIRPALVQPGGLKERGYDIDEKEKTVVVKKNDLGRKGSIDCQE